jgi:macrolide transport system ATP-binding/permease protein
VTDSLIQDVRYALRTLRRAPLFAATVAVTMGLGLGLLGSAFTILNAYLLRPIDLPDARSLYSLSWNSETTRLQKFTLADYEAIQPQATRFAGLAAVHDVTVMQDSVSTSGLLVTGNYFELLGARPALGRLLRPSDALARGAAPVVVLSNIAWRSRYGSNPAIVGQQIPLGRQRFEVVGVLEPQAYLAGQEMVSFWAPLTMASAFVGVDPWSQRDVRSLRVVARLRPNVTEASLQAWFDVWLRQRIPATSDDAPVVVRVGSLATRIPLEDTTLTMLVFVLSVFGLVLLVAAANVTNLLLARALQRQPEIAVRLALGASRWRVARQLIVESLVLAVPAAAAGFGLIMLTARVFPAVIVATFPPDVPAPVENIVATLDPDWRVLSFLGAAAILSALIITLLPAGRLAGTRLTSAARGQASSDVRGSRVRSGLVAMQIAVCSLFLVAAFGLVDESSRLASPLPNISYDRVSNVRIDPAIRARIVERLAASGAVREVAYTSKPPGIGGSLPTARMSAPATTVVANAGYTFVSPGYFPLFDIQIVRGRAFTPAEATAGGAVVLVSRSTAAALWPGLDPIGQTLDLGAVPGERSDRRLPRGTVRVIGVTEDVATGSLTDAKVDSTCVYFPANGETMPELMLLVRTPVDDVAALTSSVTAAVRTLAPDTPFQVTRMRSLLGLAAWIFQAFSVTASLLGIVALLFAYSGTHAVVSFLVAQRRREFGLRMALGASVGQIVQGMMVDTSRIAAIGIVAGVAVAFAFTRLASGSNPIVPTFGPRPFLIGVAVVVVATAVAALLPLRETARIDPAQALRTD